MMIVVVVVAAKTATELEAVQSGKVVAAEVAAVQGESRATAAAPARAEVGAAAVAVEVHVASEGGDAVENETVETEQSEVETEGIVESEEQNGRTVNEGAAEEGLLAAADGATVTGSVLVLEDGRDGDAARANADAPTAAVKAVNAVTRSAPAELEASVAARMSPRARSPAQIRRTKVKDRIAVAVVQRPRKGKEVLRLKVKRRKEAGATIAVLSANRSENIWRKWRQTRWRRQGRQLQTLRWHWPHQLQKKRRQTMLCAWPMQKR